MQPCTILADVIGCRPINPQAWQGAGRKSDFRAIEFGDRTGVLMTGSIPPRMQTEEGWDLC